MTLVNEVLRPTFLIRSVVLATGDSACEDASLPPQASQFHVSKGEIAERVWQELESLILALTLAGYEVPELLIAAPNARAGGYLKFLCKDGSVVHETGSWASMTGGSLAVGTWLAFALRTTVRRTLGRPSPHPPIELAGVTPAYLARPDANDSFADPRDGWIHLSTRASVGDADTMVKGTAVSETRDAIVEALAHAWQTEPDDGQVGLLWYFEPRWWESALDRTSMVDPFDWLCSKVWAWLSESDTMADFLRCAPGERDASLGKVVDRSGAEQAMIDEAEDDWFKSRKPLKKSIDALEARCRLFRRTDANLPLVLAGLEKLHYALALFALHDFGLIRMLPLPLEHTAEIPWVDLTGWYETVDQVDSDDRPWIATLQVNQAGDHLEGWMYDDQLRRWDVKGDLDTPTPLHYNVSRMRTEMPIQGSITAIPAIDRWSVDFTVTVTFGSFIYEMVRRDRHARVSPAEVIAALASPPADLEALMAPLHTLSQQGIGRAIEHLMSEMESITPLLDWGWRLDGTFNEIKAILVEGNILDFNGEAAVETPMLARFRMEAGSALLRTPIQAADGTDGWTHLLGMMQEEPAHTVYLKDLLAAGPAPHQYTFQMGGVGIAGELAAGAQVDAGAFRIGCRINHLPACAPVNVTPASHAWAHNYTGLLLKGGTGGGPKVEVSVTVATLGSPNDLETASNWTPDDFAPSYFGSVGAAGEVSAFWGGGIIWAPPVPVWLRPWLLGLSGTELEGYLFINRRGAGAFGFSHGWAASIGAGVGGGLSGSVEGVVGLLDTRWTGASVQLPPPAPPRHLLATVNGEVEQGFEFDSDVLLPATKSVLLLFIARYRALFESPTTFVLIEGDSSPPGDEAYNESLSWRRALAAYAFLRSALTAPPSDDWELEQHALAVPDGRIRIVAFGEMRPHLEGLSFDEDAPEWKRVKIALNDQVLVIL